MPHEPTEKWNAIYCSDCKAGIAYSPEPLKMYQPIYCYRCAETHAEVATVMMPIGSPLNKHELYRVGGVGSASKDRTNFIRLWDKLYAKLEQHRVAKVDPTQQPNEINS